MEKGAARYLKNLITRSFHSNANADSEQLHTEPNFMKPSFKTKKLIKKSKHILGQPCLCKRTNEFFSVKTQRIYVDKPTNKLRNDHTQQHT